MMSEVSRVINLVLADDHPIVRSGIRSELSRHSDLKVIGEAKDGNEALTLSETLKPDLLFLDINMPGLRAVEIIRKIRQQPFAPRVVVLSAYGDYEHVVALLAAGARGYVLKDDDPDEIVHAARAAMRGILWLSPRVAQVVEYVVSRVSENTHERILTARELDVLKRIVRGWDNQTIAQNLNIAEATVKFHITNIYDKLAVTSRVEAVLYAIRQGLAGPDL